MNTGSSDEQIKTNFRTLAFKYHPDSHENQGITSKEELDEIHQKFNLVNTAYEEVLSDPKRS